MRLLIHLLAPIYSVAALRVAVFGGSGFIGGHVCKALISAGCTVTSISRNGCRTPGAVTLSGKCPTVMDRFKDEAWVSQVEWTQANAVEPYEVKSALADGVDAVVSCIGTRDVLRASADGWVSNRWSAKSEELYSTNYEPNAVAFSASRAAGAKRCAYIAVSSDAEMAYGGTQPGLYKAKRDAAASARSEFGESATCFSPHQVVASDDPRLKLLDSGWARAAISLNRAIGSVGYRGEDFVTKVSLTPPCAVSHLAIAVVAAVTGTVAALESERCVLTNDGGSDGVEVCDRGHWVDGTSAIDEFATRAGALSAVCDHE